MALSKGRVWAHVGRHLRSTADLLGFTVVLGVSGAVALILDRRQLAGALWLALGAGAVGASFDKATGGALTFTAVRPLSKSEHAFLVAHVPFVLLGAALLMGVGDGRRSEAVADI